MQTSKVTTDTATGGKEELPFVQYGTRRIYKLWFKIQVVEETLVPGASVSIVARRHNINTNVVFAWIKQHRQGVLKPLAFGAKDGFVPVGVIGEQGQVLPPASPPQNLVNEAAPVKTNLVTTSLLPLPTLPASRSSEPLASAGSIELQLSGAIKVRVEGHVDVKMLRNVLPAAREFT